MKSTITSGDGTRGSELPLHSYLGMHLDEYQTWVEKPNVFPFIVDAHRHGKSLKQVLAQSQRLPMAARAANREEAQKVAEWLQQIGRA